MKQLVLDIKFVALLQTLDILDSVLKCNSREWPHTSSFVKLPCMSVHDYLYFAPIIAFYEVII